MKVRNGISWTERTPLTPAPLPRSAGARGERAASQAAPASPPENRAPPDRRCAPVLPFVDLRPEHQRALASFAHQVFLPFRHAEGDALQLPGPLANAETQMAFAAADFPGFADNLQVAGQKQRLRIARPIRLQLTQRIDDVGRQAGKWHLGVDLQARVRRRWAKLCASHFAKTFAERDDVLRGDAKTCRRRMAAADCTAASCRLAAPRAA